MNTFLWIVLAVLCLVFLPIKAIILIGLIGVGAYYLHKNKDKTNPPRHGGW